MNKFGRFGRILGLGAMLVGASGKDAPPAEARESASVTQKGERPTKHVAQPDERELADRIQARHVIERYRGNLATHEENFARVRAVRSEFPLRWDALLHHVPTGRSQVQFERAKYLINRMVLHMRELGPVSAHDNAATYRNMYWAHGRTLNWANQDFAELYGFNQDVQDAAYAYFIERDNH